MPQGQVPGIFRLVNFKVIVIVIVIVEMPQGQVSDILLHPCRSECKYIESSCGESKIS